MAELSGEPRGDGRRIAVIASRFNIEITQKLADGALDALVRHGVAADDIDLVWVPGAWELPPLARRLMATDRYAAVVAVGAVIRGETPHFDYVAGEAARGLARASEEFDVPVGFGVLTCDTDEQAEARAGGAHGNKGADAALAALEMADLFERLDTAFHAEAGADAQGNGPDHSFATLTPRPRR
jgi:6,7-dimethyl-8-ribityllumazine synthase